MASLQTTLGCTHNSLSARLHNACACLVALTLAEPIASQHIHSLKLGSDMSQAWLFMTANTGRQWMNATSIYTLVMFYTANVAAGDLHHNDEVIS